MARKMKGEALNPNVEEEGVADVTETESAGSEDELEAGHVVDLITGEGVKLSELEQIRQEEERKLLEEFGYPVPEKKDLIRLDHRVQPRQLKARRFSLVVLRPKIGDEPDEERISILIDIQKPKTKAEDSKKGAELTAEYLRDTPKAEFAVWTNGKDRIVYWKEPGKIKVRSVLVNDIPRFGKGAEDCFAQNKSVLRVAGGLSLRQAFQRCHDYIYAHRGGSNETIFWEFLKIVFAKIQDERNLQKGLATGAEVERMFRIASLEERNDDSKAEQVKARLDSLYHQVRTQYPELFGATIDTIDLPAPIVAYVVAQLAEYDFLNSSVDVKGEAYEAIVGKNLQGTRGEFFTPRNAVKVGIRMLDPAPGMKCIDPSCGTGGFIVVILNYVAEKIRAQMLDMGLKPDGKDVEKYNHQLRLAAQSVFGLDINPNLVRVARMNMLMNNDGQGGITHLDSLGSPEKWTFAKGKVKRWQANGKWKEVPIEDFFHEELQFGTFDIVATNPPFGAKIKIESEAVLSQYELARKWVYDENRQIWVSSPTLQSGVAPEILFLERCVKLLKPGTGRLCIVVPDGLLGNPDDEYIRYWLLKHCEVLALVDMPVELFLPKVGMQTHLVFLRRKSTEEMNEESLSGKPKDYPIFMAIAKKVGKDRRGNPVYKRDQDGRALDQFRDFKGMDLYQVYRRSTVLQFEPEVDEHGRMIDDDLPFIAKAYHEFLEQNVKGKVNHDS
jgi:type I restriction enzyme M protein